MKALILDTETTGLVRNRTLKLEQQPSIIEIFLASVNLKTGKVSKEFHTFIKPPKPLSDMPASGDRKSITEITGITNEMLESAPTFSEVSKNIFKMIEKAPLVIAHNAKFDCTMLELEAERLKYELRFPRIQCTVEATVAMKGYRLTLTNLHKELFGVEFDGSHRAKSDVAALTKCAVELFKRGLL